MQQLDDVVLLVARCSCIAELSNIVLDLLPDL